jgi:hypothetical protein
LNALRVKQAAAEVGRGEVERMTARSRADGFFLMPAWMPVRRYPDGKDSDGMGLCRCDLEGVGLVVKVDENRFSEAGSRVAILSGYLIERFDKLMSRLTSRR